LQRWRERGPRIHSDVSYVARSEKANNARKLG
jgi:hypothetical protein